MLIHNQKNGVGILDLQGVGIGTTNHTTMASILGPSSLMITAPAPLMAALQSGVETRAFTVD